MKYRSVLYVFTIFILSLGKVFGQSDLVTFPSPTVMSLGVFGDFPAELVTGVPDIQVPLYDLKYKGIKIPLGLNYNTNLVKPDEHPGWVGLGWNLTDGGSITRVVNDKPDDSDIFDPYLNDHTNTTHVGYYYKHGYLNGDWTSVAAIQNATSDLLNYPVTGAYFTQPIVVNDYQPDEFDFNFLGFHGAFYMDELGGWKVRCDQRLKVDFNSADMISFEGYWNGGLTEQSGFGKFTITDVSGIKYVFGGLPSAIEYSSSLETYQDSPLIPKTWHLTQIILPNSETIDFQYARGTAIMQPVRVRNLAIQNAVYAGSVFEYSGSVIFPSYLSSITTPIEQVIFNRSNSSELGYNRALFDKDYGIYSINFFYAFDNISYDNSYTWNPYVSFTFLPGVGDFSKIHYAQLNSIIVNNRQSAQNVLSFSFNYDNAVNERLRLQNVSKNSLSGTSSELCSFNYNSPMLPTYLADQSDHWGFFNGTTANYSGTIDDFIASKEPNPTSMQAEILNRVTYSTGGYSTYRFEPHTYSQQLDYDRSNPLLAVAPEKIGGGLRIAEIRKYDNNDAVINWHKYFYVNNYIPGNSNQQSSGILGGRISYNFGYALGTWQKISGVLSSTVSLPLSENSNGSNVGYSEVAELFSDGGYTISDFSNFDNGEYMDERPVTFLYPVAPSLIYGTGLSYPNWVSDFTSKAFKRGKLLRQRVFTNNNGLLSDKNIQYTEFNKSTEYVRNISTENNYIYYNGSFQMNYAGTAFKTYTYSYLPTTETTTLYNDLQSPITTTINHVIDPITLNTLETNQTNSKGEYLVKQNFHPREIVFRGEDYSGVYGRMLAQNNIAPVITSTDYINNNPVTAHRIDYVETTQNFFQPGSESFAYGYNPFRQIATYAYDNVTGNVLSSTKLGGPVKSYIFGYNDLLPVAEIKNASYQPVTTGYSSVVLHHDLNQSFSQYFFINAYGLSTIGLNYNGVPSGLDAATVNCQISGPNGYATNFTLCQCSNSSCGLNSFKKVLSGLAPGGYLLSANWISQSNLNTDMRLDINYAMLNNTSECFYQGFEDIGTTGQAHTGLKFNLGGYSVNFVVPNNRVYLLSYWYRVNNVWIYASETYTTPHVILPAGADAIDDVRIHPVDALMNTYTYDLINGITSITDPKNTTTYYEYDGLQRLVTVKDKDGNITKHIDYHYKQ